MAVKSDLGFVDTLALTFEVSEIGRYGVPNAVRPGIGQLAADLPRLLLSLPEGKDRRAVGIGDIVSGADSIRYIFLIAGVAPDDPFALSLPLAVAEVKALADCPVIGLASRLQLAPSSPRLKLRIPHPSG